MSMFTSPPAQSSGFTPADHLGHLLKRRFHRGASRRTWPSTPPLIKVAGYEPSIVTSLGEKDAISATIHDVLAQLEAQRDDLNTLIDNLKDRLLDAVEAGTTITANGEPVYKVQRGNLRYNPTKAQQIIPPDLLAQATQTVEKVDPRLLRGLVPPAVWEACCDRGRPYLRGL